LAGSGTTKGNITMKWRAHAELIGVAGIFLGLFFVQREIQLNSTIARAELSAETVGNLFTLDQRLMEPEMAEVWITAMDDPGRLTISERVQINTLLRSVLTIYERECYYLSLGIFPECETVLRLTALEYFGSEYGRAYWESAKKRLVAPNSVSISSLVDEVLSESSPNNYLQFDYEITSRLKN
jgi:hypothetical protein